LKIFTANFDHLLLSTANISERGLSESPNGNLECAILVNNIRNQDRLYFEQILAESLHVNDSIYSKLTDWYEKQVQKKPISEHFEDIVPPFSDRDFLISSLPMTRDIRTLIEGYKRIGDGLPPSNNRETIDCVYHDLANYRIDIGLSSMDFELALTKSFFEHPFIRRIEELISPTAHFGQVKEWVQKNCVDVPVPSRRELTGNVQVLLEWFVSLGNGKYVVDVPGSFSQRIRRAS
jgi:hypothetical protein